MTKLELALVSTLLLYAQSSPQPTPPKTTKTKTPTTVFVPPPASESPEHVFAASELEAAKSEFVHSQEEYKKKLAADFNPRGCKVFPELIRHPVTIDSVDDYMVSCVYETKKARYVMDQMGEALEEAEIQLRDLDKCLGVYRATIDKKMSDQTTRDVEQIKTCRAEDLYPPRTK